MNDRDLVKIILSTSIRDIKHLQACDTLRGRYFIILSDHIAIMGVRGKNNTEMVEKIFENLARILPFYNPGKTVEGFLVEFSRKQAAASYRMNKDHYRVFNIQTVSL